MKSNHYAKAILHTPETRKSCGCACHRTGKVCGICCADGGVTEFLKPPSSEDKSFDLLKKVTGPKEK
jgi:hypothetical protein